MIGQKYVYIIIFVYHVRLIQYSYDRTKLFRENMIMITVTTI